MTITATRSTSASTRRFSIWCNGASMRDGRGRASIVRSPRSGAKTTYVNRRAPTGRGETYAAPAEAASPIDERSLTDRAYSILEEMIVTLRLPPGGAVSEASLSKALEIGRTPIREALQRLARERLVTILPRRGILVTEINVKSQLRLLEVRREVERLIARSAARRAHLRAFSAHQRRDDVHARRPRVQRALLEGRTQRVRRRRNGLDALAFAPLLVSPLPGSRRHAGNGQIAREHRARDRQGRRARCRPRARPPDRRDREVHARNDRRCRMSDHTRHGRTATHRST